VKTTQPTTPDPGSPPATSLEFFNTVLADTDADGFVHVGDRFDDELRYLTRFSGPDRPYAFVYTGSKATATLCAPRLFHEQAQTEFIDRASDTTHRQVRTEQVGEPAGIRAVSTLQAAGISDGTILVPQQIPHDAALYLEQAGYELRSTDAVTVQRQRKTPAEIGCLRCVQQVTAAGMAQAEKILAESTEKNGVLRWSGAALTTEVLRRQINAILAQDGVQPAGNTVIGAGSSAADLHFTGVEEINAGETVLIDISPRGPHGYYGDMTRTFVVEGDGGWERRAYVAVEAALDAALRQLAPGVDAATVHEEAAAEIGAYGFPMVAEEGEIGFTHGTGHGVGLSLHEPPILSRETPLESGMVVTVEPGVYDPDRGGVRLEELVLITAAEPGYEILAPYPRSITPTHSR